MTFYPPSPSPALGALRLVDLGTVTVAEVMSDGPKTIYTPAAGEVVILLYLQQGFVALDNSWELQFDPFFTAFDLGACFVGADLSNNGMVLLTGIQGLYLPTAPIVAKLGIGVLPSILGPIGTWAALHAYAIGDAITDGAGHIQVVTTAGTSDASLPTFDDSGSTTTDDSVTWTDGGLAPTQGSVHLVAQVGVPAAR